MSQIGKHFDVSGPLEEVIQHFYCVQTPADFEKTDQHLSPNLEMMLVFNFGNPIRFSFANENYDGRQIERIAVLGPLRKLLNYELLPSTDMIAAVFHADGFYRLFQLPVGEMGEELVMDPDAILNITGFQDLWEILKELSGLSERIELLKQYALAFIGEPQDSAVSLINSTSYFNDPKIQPARAMAADSEVSERTIQMRFKKYVGYSSKELLRFLRFKQVIGKIQHQENKEIDWYALVEEFGYHDQSHLIKDFQHYLGTTPRKFVTEIVGKDFCVTRPGKYY